MDFDLEKAKEVFKGLVRVTGPYKVTTKDGYKRNFIRMYFDHDVNFSNIRSERMRTNYALSRFVYEIHVGNRIGSNEHIHHIDGDCLNDSLVNLELLSAEDHSRYHREKQEIEKPGIRWCKITCQLCFKQKLRRKKAVDNSSKRGMPGPFCDAKCRGRYIQLVKNDKIDPVPPQPLGDFWEIIVIKD